jgi:hypothetical protein
LPRSKIGDPVAFAFTLFRVTTSDPYVRRTGSGIVIDDQDYSVWPCPGYAYAVRVTESPDYPPDTIVRVVDVRRVPRKRRAWQDGIRVAWDPGSGDPGADHGRSQASRSGDTMITTDTLIISIPQVDGSTRRIHAQDPEHANIARAILASDPSMVDHLHGVDGIRLTIEQDLPQGRSVLPPVKTRTITLTGRPPVKIREDQWPEIASAKERPGSMRNGTPVPNYETDEYSIRVRQHEDGRTLVYGVVNAATVWTGTEHWRGGELLSPTIPGDAMSGDAIATAIRRIGEAGGMPDSVIRKCIADLPADEI